MNKQITLKQDKETKNTVRYTDGNTIQIYVPKSDLPTPFPSTATMTLSFKQ